MREGRRAILAVAATATAALLTAPAVAQDDALARSLAAERAGDATLALTQAKAAVAAVTAKTAANRAATVRAHLARLLATDDPDQAIALLDRAIPDLPRDSFARVEATATRAIALCYAKGIVACREPLAEVTEPLATMPLAGEERERAAFLMSTAGNIAIAAGQRELAETKLKQALTLLDQPAAQQGIFAAQAYANAADQATRTSDYAAAITRTARAIAITERLRGPAHRDLVDPLSLLGEAYMRATRYAEAGEVLIRAVVIADSAANVPVMAHVLALRSLGGYYAQTGRRDLGVGLFERAVRLGEADPTTSRMMAGVYRDLASLHIQAKDYDRARPILAKAAANAEGAAGKQSSSYGGAMLDIAEMEYEAGNLDVAAAAAVEARMVFAKAIEKGNARNGDPVAVLGRVALARGDARGAAALFDEALALMKPRDSRSIALLATKARAAEALARAEPGSGRGWSLAREAGDAMTARLVREAMLAGASGVPSVDQRAFYDATIGVAWRARSADR